MNTSAQAGHRTTPQGGSRRTGRPRSGRGGTLVAPGAQDDQRAAPRGGGRCTVRPRTPQRQQSTSSVSPAVQAAGEGGAGEGVTGAGPRAGPPRGGGAP